MRSAKGAACWVFNEWACSGLSLWGRRSYRFYRYWFIIGLQAKQRSARILTFALHQFNPILRVINKIKKQLYVYDLLLGLVGLESTALFSSPCEFPAGI